MLFRFARVFLVFGFFAGANWSGDALAAPKAELWARWLKHDPLSTAMIDHGAWTAFLKTYRVDSGDGVARIDYGGVGAEDKTALDDYVKLLEGTAVGGLNRSEQQAYWINFYNALTIKVILDHYPVQSILDISISPGFFSQGPWGAKLVTVEGEELSLDDIEHRILRPIWKDPRVHYAVNCASYGCPNLAAEAFTAANAGALMNQGAIDYVNHPRGVAFDGGKLIVSSIYDWFREDFGDTEQGVIEHLKQYAKPELKMRLESRAGYDGDAYDWALNAPGVPSGG